MEIWISKAYTEMPCCTKAGKKKMKQLRKKGFKVTSLEVQCNIKCFICKLKYKE